MNKHTLPNEEHVMTPEEIADIYADSQPEVLVSYIQEAIRQAVAEEREATSYFIEGWFSDGPPGMREVGKVLADEIRARK